MKLHSQLGDEITPLGVIGDLVKHSLGEPVELTTPLSADLVLSSLLRVLFETGAVLMKGPGSR